MAEGTEAAVNPGTVKASYELIKEVIADLNGARSVVIEVDNNTTTTLTRVSDHHDHGGFAKTPKGEIPPRSADVFGSQSASHSIATGTEGNVAYTNTDGIMFRIHWSNPFLGRNNCDAKLTGPGAAYYRAVATSGAGDTNAYMRFELFPKVAVGDLTWRSADLTQITAAPATGRTSLVSYSSGLYGSKQVAYIGADNHIHEVYSTGGPWAHADLSQLTGAPAASGNALAAYAWEAGRSKQVVYLTADGHIHELYIVAGGTWAHADLTGITGAPAASGSALAAYAWEAGEAKQVVFMTTDGHIHELYVSVGDWAHADLTEITGGPPATGSRLAGYGCEVDGSKRVVYVTADRHVQELSVSVGQGWTHADLTQLAGAPPIGGDALAAYAWDEGETKQVAYLAGNGHIHELYASRGGNWTDADLTQITGAPSAVGPALDGYSGRHSDWKQVVFLTADRHVHALGVRTGGSWSHTDLTALTGSPRALATTSLSGYSWYPSDWKQVVYLTEGKHVQELYA